MQNLKKQSSLSNLQQFQANGESSFQSNKSNVKRESLSNSDEEEEQIPNDVDTDKQKNLVKQQGIIK